MIPIIAGAMMLGGTAASMYGQNQKDKATRRAMKDYQSAVNAKANADRAALLEQQGILSGLGRERQGSIGEYLHGLQMSQVPTDDGFAQRQQGALTDLAGMTQGMDSGYAYSGAPRSGAEYQQQQRAALDNRGMAEAMLAQHQDRAIQEREQMLGHKLALGDLLRGSKGKSIQEKFQLAQALRDLDWQRKTAALQGQMDNAQRKGQDMQMYGGLATQAGGMLMSYGMGSGGSSAGGGAPSSAPGPASSGNYDASTNTNSRGNPFGGNPYA